MRMEGYMSFRNQVMAAAAAFLCASVAFGQSSVTHPFNTGSASYTLNSGAGTAYFNYYDNGGASGNYSNSAVAANSVVTFNAAPGQRIRVTFSSFTTEASWADRLYVYDGATTSASIIPSGITSAGVVSCAPQGFEGSVAPNNAGPGIVVSTGSALTFAFCSDSSVAQAGWAARVEVVGYTVGGTITSPAPLAGLVLSLNSGAQTLTSPAAGAFTFPSPLQTGATYAVTVQSQPAGATCAVNNGSGTVGSGAITDISVTCMPVAIPALNGTALALLSLLLMVTSFSVVRRRGSRQR